MLVDSLQFKKADRLSIDKVQNYILYIDKNQIATCLPRLLFTA